MAYKGKVCDGMERKIPTNMTLDSRLIDKIDKLAEGSYVSRSAIASLLLSDALTLREEGITPETAKIMMEEIKQGRAGFVMDKLMLAGVRPPYKCPFCDSTGLSHEGLWDHLTTVHPLKFQFQAEGPGPFQCPYCDADPFETEKELKAHVKGAHPKAIN